MSERWWPELDELQARGVLSAADVARWKASDVRLRAQHEAVMRDIEATGERIRTMKAMLALLMLLGACEANVDGDAGERAPARLLEEPELHLEPLATCAAGAQGPATTCCGINDQPSPHAYVCGCAASGNGYDCTNGPRLCACPGGTSCIAGTNGEAASCQ